MVAASQETVFLSAHKQMQSKRIEKIKMRIGSLGEEAAQCDQSLVVIVH